MLIYHPRANRCHDHGQPGGIRPCWTVREHPRCMKLGGDRLRRAPGPRREVPRAVPTYAGTKRLLHAAPELVRFRQTMSKPAGIGAVAAPVRQFLHRHALLASRRILPGEPALGIEG